MSDESQKDFSGFMPMINQVFLSKEISMINTEGELLNAHAVTIKCTDGSEHVFSINQFDLMRLSFLITKIVNSE